MRTDDLISVLAADARNVSPLRPALFWGAFAGAAVSVALLLMTIGFRPGILSLFSNPRVVFKIAVTLSVAVSSIVLALRVAQPGASLRGPLSGLGVSLALLVGGVLVELFALPKDLWYTAMVGRYNAYCLMFIPILSVAPLFAFSFVLQRGAPQSSTLGGAAMGLASGGIAAAIYAWHCPDDSPLFVAAWYVIAIFAVSAVGGLLGKRVLKW